MNVTVSDRPLKSGNHMIRVDLDGDIACDLVIQPNGTLVLGADVKLTSGAMPCHRAARPNWKRHRFERVP